MIIILLYHILSEAITKKLSLQITSTIADWHASTTVSDDLFTLSSTSQFYCLTRDEFALITMDDFTHLGHTQVTMCPNVTC
jgi:dihydrodipicolinate synthase/N-acetylneuraminate lyase